MDIENLDANQDFDELPDTYTIFITEKDVLGRGLPYYRIERTNLETGGAFQDGSHILYINGSFRDESELGKLMHDFSCHDADDMNYPLMREVTNYYKETPEGVEYMCRAFEETRQEGWERGMQQGMQQKEYSSIRNLMKNLNWTSAQAMDALGIPEVDRAKYAELLKQ